MQLFQQGHEFHFGAPGLDEFSKLGSTPRRAWTGIRFQDAAANLQALPDRGVARHYRALTYTRLNSRAPDSDSTRVSITSVRPSGSTDQVSVMFRPPRPR